MKRGDTILVNNKKFLYWDATDSLEWKEDSPFLYGHDGNVQVFLMLDKHKKLFTIIETKPKGDLLFAPIRFPTVRMVLTEKTITICRK